MEILIALALLTPLWLIYSQLCDIEECLLRIEALNTPKDGEPKGIDS